MSTNEYDKGDRIKVTGTWTDEDGTATDPDTVTFRIRKPSGTRVSYIYLTDAEVVKDSTGVYYVIMELDEVGTWRWRWESTGSAQAADEGKLIAKRSFF